MRSPLRPPFAAVLALFAVAVALPAAALTPPPSKASPLGPELAVSAPEAARRAEPAVAGFSDGGFAVAWLQEDDASVRLRLFDRHDRAVGGEIAVGEARLHRVPARHRGPDLAVLADGTLLVVWADGACPPGEGPLAECAGHVLGRSFAADGTPLVGPFALSEWEGAHSGPRVAALAGGGPLPVAGFVVAWTLDDSPDCSGAPAECLGSDVVARVWPFGFAGEPSGTLLVNERLGREENAGGVAGTEDGGFVVVWEEEVPGDAGPAFDVLRRRFDAVGNPLEGAVQVNQASSDFGQQHSPDVAARQGGGHVVAWTDSAYPTYHGGDDDSVALRLFGEDGAAEGEEILATVDSHGDQQAPAVAAGVNDGGGFFVAWEDGCADALCEQGQGGADGSGSGVLTTYFSGALWWGEILYSQTLPTQVSGDQLAPDVAAAGPGRWVSVWVSEVGEGATAIRARRLGFAGAGCDEPCLHGRFEIEVSWKDFQGHRGAGVGTVQGDDWATFTFFHPDNVELAVKVLDARAVNGRFWVFAGALSNVEYRLTVNDVVTGLRTVWTNPAGTFLSRADTSTFEAANEVLPPAGGAAAAVGPGAAAEAIGPCPPGEVCLQGGRFALSATWRDFAGNTGGGTVHPLTADTARISFFHPGNPELIVKVLDARSVDGHFWVFYASLSNVEFELTVSDLETGEEAVYANPSGTFASRGDTSAFPRP